ncbi:HupE/UreJ family protein [Bacillus sp. BGMRC 2118]|nr:HupE/UreJ family protein [Bacillus sp. BGMRC 2118]
MKRVILVLLVFMLGTLGFINKAMAHPYSAGYTTLYLVNQNVELTFSIDIESVEESVHGIHDEEEPFKDIFEEYKPLIDEWIQKNLIVSLGGEKATLELVYLKLDKVESKQVVTAAYKLPNMENGQTIKLTDYFYEGARDTNYVNFLTVKQTEQSTQIALQAGNREWLAIVDGLEEGTESFVDSNEPAGVTTETSDFWSFFKLGVHHILTGYDHLLFLLALIIRPQRVRELVVIVTAFTVGHSLTIALGTLDIINLPSLFVEVMIALSICYVAVENIFKSEIKYRWLVTLIFGLIHGLGFSSLLKESLGSKSQVAVELFAFNIGIEVIQLLLVLILIPLLLKLYMKLDSKKVVVPISLAISLFGAFWLVQRLFGF